MKRVPLAGTVWQMTERSFTSHERMSGQPWDASYADGPAPWDVGAQPAVVRLAETGAFRGDVLDAGCGSGDNALHLASLGLTVTGVDVAETALERARGKAAERGLDVTFEVADALHLERLGRTFDTVLDCGLFHSFDGDERRQYVAGLAAITAPGSTVHVLCFADQGEGQGPHPVSRADLETAFEAWDITSIELTSLDTRFADAVPAWLATITRT